MMYHPIDRRYILFFHLDTPEFEVPAVGIAVSPDIRGEHTAAPLAQRACPALARVRRRCTTAWC